MAARTHSSITLALDFTDLTFPSMDKLHYAPVVELQDKLGNYVKQNSDQLSPCIIENNTKKCHVEVTGLSPGRMYRIVLHPVNAVKGSFGDDTMQAVATVKTYTSCSCSSDGSGHPKALSSPESSLVQSNGRISLEFIEDSGK